MRFILSLGADPLKKVKTVYDDSEDTPLYNAISYGLIDVVREMMEVISAQQRLAEIDFASIKKSCVDMNGEYDPEDEVLKPILVLLSEFGVRDDSMEAFVEDLVNGVRSIGINTEDGADILGSGSDSDE